MNGISNHNIKIHNSSASEDSEVSTNSILSLDLVNKTPDARKKSAFYETSNRKIIPKVVMLLRDIFP